MRVRQQQRGKGYNMEKMKERYYPSYCNEWDKQALDNVYDDLEEGEIPDTADDTLCICPWCGYSFGYLGYADCPEMNEEGEHNMTCEECGKNYTLTTSVSFFYETERA